MQKVIETSRLYLREFELSDAKNMFDLNSDKEVIKYTGDNRFSSESEALEFLASYNHYKIHGFGRWAVILKENDAFIGWNGLKLNEENDIDIGFRFYKKYWGRGFAFESAKAVLEHGLNVLKIDCIVGRVIPENIASVRVLEKLGMKFKKQGLCHGIEDARIYSISKQA